MGVLVACNNVADNKSPPTNPAASANVRPLTIKSMAAVTFPGWDERETDRPTIALYGVMTGKQDDSLKFVDFGMNCTWPRPSDRDFTPGSDAPNRWNCEVRHFTWRAHIDGVFTRYSKDHIGKPEKFAGGYYEQYDQEGRIPAEKLQPQLVDSGTALLFPGVGIEGHGELRLSCSQPLRDLHDRGGLKSFEGCRVVWRHDNVPDLQFRMTIGETVTIPKVFVSAD